MARGVVIIPPPAGGRGLGGGLAQHPLCFATAKSEARFARAHPRPLPSTGGEKNDRKWSKPTRPRYFSSAYCTVSVTEDPTCPGSTGVAGAASALNRADTIIGMGGWPPLLLSASETSRAER